MLQEAWALFVLAGLALSTIYGAIILRRDIAQNGEVTSNIEDILQQYGVFRVPDNFADPESRFEAYSQFLIVAMILIMLVFFYINLEAYSQLAIAYFIIGITGLVLSLAYSSVTGSFGTADSNRPGVGLKGDRGWWTPVIHGFLIGGFITLPQNLGLLLNTPALDVIANSILPQAIVLASAGGSVTILGQFIFTGLFAPVTEEYMFNVALGGETSHIVGIVLATILATVGFMLFHFSVYGTALGALFYLGFIRIMMLLSLYETGSWVGGLISHIIINVSVLVASLL